MRLRTKMLVAFLVLSVVPLASVTVYSYNSSLRAFQTAVESEGRELAAQIGSRMDAVTTDLRRRIDRVSGLPFYTVQGPDLDALARMKETLLAEMGESARYLEQLEFVPATETGGAGTADTPAAADPVEIRISGLGDEVASGPLSFQVVEREGGIAIQRVPEAAAPPEPRPSEPPPQVAGGEQQAATELVRGLEALARELEVRDRQRRAGVDVPAASQEQFQSRLTEAAGLPARPFPGAVKAQVSSREVLRQVLSRTRRERGEIPFALDREGNLYTPDPADRPALEGLGLAEAVRRGRTDPQEMKQGWITVLQEDPNSGLYFGIARPVAESLMEIRVAMARNLGLGLGMVGLSLVGIAILSERMTRNLATLTQGAERLATGDLSTQVPVRSRDEIGILSGTFNRMARDLGEVQRRQVEQERMRKELEIGREIQRQLLPRGTLRSPVAEVAGFSVPALEVGGDFFNYFTLPDGSLALLVGDVSGKGVPAALLMANLQATLRAWLPLEPDLGALAARLDHELERTTPLEVYATLFLAVLSTDGRRLRYVNCGHNPPFVLRGKEAVLRLDATGRPVGLVPGGPYDEVELPLGPGAILFVYTDGLVESEDGAGEPFGLERLERVLVELRGASLDGLLMGVETAVRRFRQEREADDDATFVALRVAEVGDVTPGGSSPPPAGR